MPSDTERSSWRPLKAIYAMTEGKGLHEKGHLLARLADELRHGLRVVVGEREVGGDGAVVPPQQPDGRPVVRARRRLLRVVVAHRHAALAQRGHLIRQMPDLAFEV